MGLRAFLYQRQVPDIDTPLCRYGRGPETLAHVILYCPDLQRQRAGLRAQFEPNRIQSIRDLGEATIDPKRNLLLLKWLLATGRLPEYRLAIRIAEIQDWEDAVT